MTKNLNGNEKALDIVTKLLEEKIKKLNEESSEVDYDSDAIWSGYGDVVNDDMTADQIESIVNNRLREKIMENETNDRDKVKLFKAIGSNSEKPLDYKSTATKFGVDHLRQLDDKQMLQVAAENGWSLEDAYKKRDEAIAKKIKENAEQIHNDHKDDAKLAREYLVAKYDGDDEKMKEIKSKMKDGAEMFLDENSPLATIPEEIPLIGGNELPDFVARLAQKAGYLGGGTMTDAYREQIANPTAEDNDSFNPYAGGRGRAFTADLASAGIGMGGGKVAGAIVGKAGLNVGFKALDKLANKLIPHGYGGVAKTAVGSIPDVGINVVAELARQGISEEDYNPEELGVVGLSEATVPFALEIATSKLGKVGHGLGPMLSQFTRAAKKSGDEELLLLDADSKIRDLNKVINETPLGSSTEASPRLEHQRRTSPTAKELQDDWEKTADMVGRAEMEKYYTDPEWRPDLPNGVAREYEAWHVSFPDYLKHMKAIDYKPYEWTDVADKAERMKKAYMETYSMNPDEEAQLLINGWQHKVSDMDASLPQQRIDDIVNEQATKMADLSDKWNVTNQPKTTVGKVVKAVGKGATNAGARVVPYVSNQLSRQATSHTYEDKRQRDKLNRWQKGFATWEEKQTQEYKDWWSKRMEDNLLLTEND